MWTIVAEGGSLLMRAVAQFLMRARGRDRFQPHGLGRVLHGDEDADGRLFPVHDVAEVPELRNRDAARLHRDDDRLELADTLALENNLAVNALVRALLALDGPGTDEAQRPPRQLGSALEIELYWRGVREYIVGHGKTTTR